MAVCSHLKTYELQLYTQLLAVTPTLLHLIPQNKNLARQNYSIAKASKNFNRNTIIPNTIQSAIAVELELLSYSIMILMLCSTTE